MLEGTRAGDVVEIDVMKKLKGFEKDLLNMSQSATKLTLNGAGIFFWYIGSLLSHKCHKAGLSCKKKSTTYLFEAHGKRWLNVGTCLISRLGVSAMEIHLSFFFAQLPKPFG